MNTKEKTAGGKTNKASVVVFLLLIGGCGDRQSTADFGLVGSTVTIQDAFPGCNTPEDLEVFQRLGRQKNFAAMELMLITERCFDLGGKRVTWVNRQTGAWIVTLNGQRLYTMASAR